MITQIDQLYQIINHPLQQVANQRNIQIKASAHYIDFIRNNRELIRLSVKHFIYAADMINSFEYYFSAVNSIEFNGMLLVDYSCPKYHDVIGFDVMPVFFPSLAEPIVTSQQYLTFANIREGDSILDLGAYSGLTSIMFKELCGKSGRVIAVEADKQNCTAIKINLNLYQKITGNQIDLLCGAVWNNDKGLSFSSEGNMGSSAVEIVGMDRGMVDKIPSFTLLQIANMHKLRSIQFIKCDIEGGECVIFEDSEFFSTHRPRIIIESHMVGNKETTEKCIHDLQKYGYECKRIFQTGVTLPLVECYPSI